MSLIGFPPPLSPRLNTSGFVPRLLSAFSGPSSPNITQTPPTSRPAANLSSHTEASKKYSTFLPVTPMQWIWTCHRCNTTYRLAVTRRCLNDGHYFCQGEVKVNRRSGQVRRHKACRAEFDYAGWFLWAEWRRDQHRDTRIDKKQRNCWNSCEYPSHCRWGDTIGVENKNLQVWRGVKGVATDPEKGPDTSSNASASMGARDATQGSSGVPKTRLSTFKEGFRKISRDPDRDRDRDYKLSAPSKYSQDILSSSEHSTEGPLSYSESSVDSDSDLLPGAITIAVTALNSESSIHPVTPTVPLAPLSPVGELDQPSPTTSRSISPNHPNEITEVRLRSPGFDIQELGDVLQGLAHPIIEDSKR